MERKLAAAICAAIVAGLSAGVASAGEVKGPPGVPCSGSTCVPSFNDTAAPANANSNCAYSGLNDENPAFGQTASIVQTAADSFKYYGLQPGVEGTAGLCQGGTNLSRQH
jgi:hypothetical protein